MMAQSPILFGSDPTTPRRALLELALLLVLLASPIIAISFYASQVPEGSELILPLSANGPEVRSPSGAHRLRYVVQLPFGPFSGPYPAELVLDSSWVSGGRTVAKGRISDEEFHGDVAPKLRWLDDENAEVEWADGSIDRVSAAARATSP